MLAEVDARFFGGAPVDFDAAVDAYVEYATDQLGKRASLSALTKPMLGLFNGKPGARAFRRHLSEHVTQCGAGISVLHDALAHVRSVRAEAA
jgi:tRNA-dihydrouridine synthase A